MKKVFHTKNTSTGFTLVELLIAMTLTVVVVGLTGFGLVVLMSKNSKAQSESERQVNLNRALDFISDEVRTASNVSDSTPAPAWAWSDLDEAGPDQGYPSAKLYLQMPWKSVFSMTVTGGLITVTNHELSNGNAVMFTGSGTMPTGLVEGQRYYVIDVTTDTFKVSSTVAGAAIPLTSNSSGSLTVNKLITYFTRDHDDIWLKPRLIKRSIGDCSVDANCDVLIDSIAAESLDELTNGFTAKATSSRQAELKLVGQLSDNPIKTNIVSTKVFARSSVVP